MLSSKNEFLWTTEHDHAVSQMKKCLTTAPVLTFFNMTKPARLCTDACRQGLGFALQQLATDGKWHLDHTA